MTDSPQQMLENLAREFATRHGLDPNLVCAIVEQESSWNQWAYRFEPAFKARYVDSLGLLITETIGRSTSWGLMQVMGQVARENGYTGDLPALCEPINGLEIGCKVLAAKIAAANGNVSEGLQRWNGGANLQYASQVLARVGGYKTEAVCMEIVPTPDLGAKQT